MQSQQPDPQQQQIQQIQMQLQMKDAELTLASKEADVMKKQAEAQKTAVETQLMPKEAEARIISALSNNLNENDEDKSFERRVKVAELALKEKQIDTGLEVTKMQKEAAQANNN